MQVLLSLLLFSVSSFGQTANTSVQDLDVPSSPQGQSSGFERVEVTGSHIRKIDVEGVAPLDTISSEEFVRSGSIEIGQVLREDPAFEAVYGNVGHVRFRGQHAGNVLILLNGLRMPKLNGGYYTSIRNLPTSAMNRVEMLKDGGSAVYGSDAMSGVMNFITKTDFDGANVGISSSVPETGVGVQRNVEGTFGKNFARGNFMAVFQYEDTDGFSELDVGSVNNGSNISSIKTSNLELGNRDVNTLSVGPACSTGVCETDELLFQQARPDNEDLSALLTGAYSFGETKVSFLGLYNRKRSLALRNPNELNWVNDSGRGGENNAIDFSQVGNSSYRTLIDNAGVVDEGFLDIRGNLVEEIGDYVVDSTEDNYNVQASVSGFIGLDWDWKVQSGYSMADFRERVVSGEANQDVLRQMFNEGRFNIVAAPGAKSDLSEAIINPVYRNRSELFTNKVVFAGELFDLGTLYDNGGLVSMAIGTEFQNESFAFNNDESLVDGTALARPVRNFSGRREVRSAFMEFSIFPVTEFEVQLAGRFDSYSDVGDTANPKVAVAYRPFKEVLFRSSVATGFRAPGITDIYAGEAGSITGLRDQVACQADSTKCGTEFYDVTTYTNEDTKAETALSYSFGTVVQPFKRTTISIDQWNFEGEDNLSALRGSDYTEIEANQGAAGLAAVGAEINRDSSGRITSMRIPRVINLGRRTLRGVDVAINSDIALGKGFDLIAGNGMSFIFERSQQRFSFEQEEDIQDSWKNRLYLGVKNDYHFFRTTMLTVSKQLVGRGSFQETLPQYSEFDMTYGYTAKWGGQFNFSIKNLANTRPPAQADDLLTFGSPDRNYSSFSPLRRRLFVSYSQNF